MKQLADFGGKNRKEKRGIHWCRWDKLCKHKDKGGMGFRNLAKFNIALLGRGWLGGGKGRPHINLARCSGFLDWRNIELKNQLGTIELGTNLFGSEEAAAILRIPLAQHQQDDSRIWSGEPSGEYTVRSSYRWTKEEPNPDSVTNNDTNIVYTISGFAIQLYALAAEQIHNRRNMPSGIALQDSEGKILYCRLEVNNRIPTTFAAKALACLQAVRMGLDLSYQRVVVEGDALSIIKKIQRNENDRSMLSPYIIDIKTLSKNFNKCRFRQMGRKGNETAHATAQEALKLNRTTYMEGQSLRTVITPAVKDARDLELS
ncbi:hypothetical protein CXB51_016292 [Gossypium anomalum]|uniref:RNase H type-1 domain-containing protein n=1 Tax=Gossypium anomalum TaxID=47600 RepID=A0A8J5Z011_9ROSI|nr:hypothetical protein CXB51_016292 [Gossypium anomalum]